MIGLRMKLFQKGKLMEEIEITDNLNETSTIKQVISYYKEDGGIRIHEKGWESTIDELSKAHKRSLISNEFLVLEMKSFLYNPEEYKKNNPFQKITKPIKNQQGKEISIINKKHHWVYEFIEGESSHNLRKITNNDLKEIAKALAIYHKYIKNFKVKKQKEDNFKCWIDRKF